MHCCVLISYCRAAVGEHTQQCPQQMHNVAESTQQTQHILQLQSSQKQRNFFTLASISRTAAHLHDKAAVQAYTTQQQDSPYCYRSHPYPSCPLNRQPKHEGYLPTCEDTSTAFAAKGSAVA